MNSMKLPVNLKRRQDIGAKAVTKTVSPFITPLFLLTAAALIIMSSPGCRFGNNKKEPSAPPNPDTVSGFYDMTAQSVTFCMKKEGQSVETCMQPSLAKIPSGLQAILTDPIALILVNLENGDGVLKNPDSSSYLYTKIQKSGDLYGPGISYSPTYPPEPLWGSKDPCSLSFARVETGKFEKYDSPRSIANGRSASGRVHYNIKREWGFAGKCDSLLDMAACYLDSTYCGGEDAAQDNELQATVQGFFGTFIDAGAFKITDVPDLRMIRYEIQY